MSPRSVKVGRGVRLVDPVQITARFYRPERGGIVGTGGMLVRRDLLDTVGTIALRGDGGHRACVEWVVNDAGERVEGSMWLDAAALVAA